ncbi:MAG: ABC transporter permease, partial [Bacillota bacterium]|nr:ABC transporter permease [Bacillota bacterium]
MKGKLAKRLLQMIIVLFGISFFTFCLTYLAPGDPVRTMYAASGTMPANEVIEATRDEMGLNDPFLVQYGRWLGNCLQGDFGVSYSMNKPVLS